MEEGSDERMKEKSCNGGRKPRAVEKEIEEWKEKVNSTF